MNKELQRARRRRYEQKPDVRAKRNKRLREDRAKNPGVQRARQLKEKYGLTVAEYEQMVALQSNCCAICFRMAGDKISKHLRIDHNHRTGAVRGLLCHQCNSALGMFQDCIPVLKNAINYLRENDAPEHGL